MKLAIFKTEPKWPCGSGQFPEEIGADEHFERKFLGENEGGQLQQPSGGCFRARCVILVFPANESCRRRLLVVQFV
jgi:hypothetical protein